MPEEDPSETFLKRLLELYDGLSYPPSDMPDRIALASRIAGLVPELELYVEGHQRPDWLEALNLLKESLKMANEGRMLKARGRMGEAARHLARVVAAKRIKAREAKPGENG